jgi:hypothetical protein
MSCFACLCELVGPPPCGLHEKDEPCAKHQIEKLKLATSEGGR